ncbi:MAG: DUF951 domain-containing protein [Clostridia bacterium]
MIFLEFKIGQVISFKKKHPCGSDNWEILRVGADFRLKCLGCGHLVMLTRNKVEKGLKKNGEHKN